MFQGPVPFCVVFEVGLVIDYAYEIYLDSIL